MGGVLNVPFLASAALYVASRLRQDVFALPLQTTVVLKCVPIGILIATVAGSRSWSAKYRAGIVVGLALSLIGDAFLALGKDYFWYGVAAFGLAHAAYIAALSVGGVPLRLERVLPLAGLAGATYWYVVRPHLPAHMTAGVVGYLAILVTMLWRSLAAIGHGTPARRQAAVRGFVGAALFFVSDAVLAYKLFAGAAAAAESPVPLDAVVMTLYYAGQAGLAASSTVLPSEPSKRKD